MSQLSDDEVEIVYLPRNKFHEAYGDNLINFDPSNSSRNLIENDDRDLFDKYADMNRTGHHPIVLTGVNNYLNDRSKGSIRRKLSLSSIAHIWSK